MSNQKNLQRLDRIKGMLIGVAYGYALRAPYERTKKYKYSRKIEFPIYHRKMFSKFPMISSIGQVTDDTEMTITLARSLIANKGYDPDKTVLLYEQWASDKRNFFMGRNTRKLFKGIKTLRGYKNRFKKLTNLESMQSNGAFMRCSPLALLSEKEIKLDCYLTNPSKVALDCNTVYLSAIRKNLNGKNKTSKELLNEAIKEAKTKEVKDILKKVEQGEEVDVNVRGKKGWCICALYCAFKMLQFKTFKEGLDYVIRLGGDTDTNSCIGGGLYGSLLGYKQLYKENKNNIDILLSCDVNKGDIKKDKKYTLYDIFDICKQLDEIF